jgi:hypothetical protein
MGTVDASAWVGGYPYRRLPDHSPQFLLRQMDRLKVEKAWVGYLPALLYRNPSDATADLRAVLAPFRDRLLAVPTIHPGMPRWEQDLNDALAAGAPAVRVYPNYLGIDAAGGEMRVFAGAAAAAGVPVALTVRLEDLRQRHPLDTAGELTPASVRALIRSDAQLRLLVSQAERSFIEEVHWGLTPEESSRIVWDIVWIWGPPEDHLSMLLETMGVDRFVFGTGMPLRIPDTAFAKLDLLSLKPAQREQILGGNLEKWKTG